jgi:hypothetical protein
MTPVNVKTETFNEQHRWKVLLGSHIIFVLFGLGDMIQGMHGDPAIANNLTNIEWHELQRSSPRIANLINMQVEAEVYSSSYSPHCRS